MKEETIKGLKHKKIAFADVIKEIGLHTVFCAFSFLISRGILPGHILPFGAAVVSAAPADYVAAAAVGVFFSYIWPAAEIRIFRYFAALFAIVAIKCILVAVTRHFTKPIVIALTAGLVSLGAGLVSTVGYPRQTVLAVVEAALSFTAAYFFAKTINAYPGMLKGVKGEELACLLITVNIVLIGMMSLNIGGISVGNILAIAFILLVSRYGQSYAGAVGGIAAAFAVALSGGGLAVALSLCLAGLFGGIFARLGKYAQVIAVVLSVLFASALGQELIKTVEIFIESLFGSALFLVVPSGAAKLLGKVFSPPAKTAGEKGVKKAVTMRLRFASSALADVSNTVDTVSAELSRINCPDFDTLLKNIEQDACSGCTLRVNCWEGRKADTASSVLEMIKELRQNGGDTEDFKMRCLRPERVKEATDLHYSDYAARVAAENRIADVRSVVSEQFSGLSQMLSDLAEEFERDEAFDERLAAKITTALKNIEINPTECGCKTDKFGRMSVEIIAPKIRGVKYSRMKILKQIEVLLSRDFEPPTITESVDKVYITLTERAAIRISSGVCQIASSPSGICGDAYNLFSDGKGRSFAVLSDGMGSGGRAAVDGAMASGLMARLLKAGFGYDSALAILNSAMLFKSTDESLATVDVAALDLYSGRLDMLKAGAAPTLVRRNGRCSVAKSTSLPAGILREIGFDKAAITLRAGDVVLMMSDGACADGVDWICKELDTWCDKSAEELAEHIAYGAKRRQTAPRPDDITVIAIVVEKAD